MTEQEVIIDAVKKALSDTDGLPFCKIESARIAQMETAIIKLSNILTGNGNPEGGLVLKVDRLASESQMLKKALEVRSNREWAILAGVLVALLIQIVQLL